MTDRTGNELRKVINETSKRIQFLMRANARQQDKFKQQLQLLALRETALLEQFRPVVFGDPRSVVAERRRFRHSPKNRRWLKNNQHLRALFHHEWYSEKYMATQGDLETSLNHFIDVGIDLGYDPHPLFDSCWCVGQLDHQPRRRHPILDFLQNGRAIETHPLFNARRYLDLYPDVANSKVPALIHYIKYGQFEGRQPFSLWDAGFIAHRHGISNLSLIDYLIDNDLHHIMPHALFDPAWYSKSCRPIEMSPLEHFVRYGNDMGLSPHALFNVPFYYKVNSDVAHGQMNALVHFVDYGYRERRTFHPLFDTAYYIRTYGELLEPDQNPLTHFLAEGYARSLAPLADFPVSSYFEIVGRTHEHGQDILSGLISEPRLFVFSSRERSPDDNHVDITPRTSGATTAENIRHCNEAQSKAIRSLAELIALHAPKQSEFSISNDLKALVRRILKAKAPQGEPQVSILIPVHNQLLYTLTCICSILEMTRGPTFEIIIADDASDDRTSEIMQAIASHVVHRRSEKNQGFLRNCNNSSQIARGSILVLLNNDTLVLPDWLSRLVEILRRPKVGMVGSKLLNSDLSLQEAGGILWNDGSAWNFGRGEDPDASEFNYVKETDYISGAAVAIPTALWRALNGFDDSFAPAYCEDTDLAFRVRMQGLTVLYAPYSEVIHHEGCSHGRLESSGIKSYQVTNRQKLYDKWRLVLDKEHFPNGEDVFVARDRSRRKPHILIVDHYIPQVDKDAGSRTMFNFIKAFCDCGFQVIFWPDNLYQDRQYIEALHSMGVEVIYGARYLGDFEKWLYERRDWIKYILLSRPHIAEKYVNIVEEVCKDSIVIYYGHDVHWRRLLDQFYLTGEASAKEESIRFEAIERQLISFADVIAYPSLEEKQFVESTYSPEGEVVAVPAWIFSPSVTEAARKKVSARETAKKARLLFVGGFGHDPNVDGVLWFVERVVPLLLKRKFKFEFWIVGSNAPDRILNLAGGRIIVHGAVSDAAMADLYDKASIAVVPLRFGAGVKGKVIEAFSKGIPVVSTSVGYQGIPDAEQLGLLGDTELAFADAIIEVIEKPGDAVKRCLKAAEFVETAYSIAAFRRALEKSIPEMKLMVH